MVQKIGPEENNIVFKFGGGLHTRASPDEIDGREAAGGFNFTIDIQNRNLVARPPFDLVGTAPNAGSINGGASLLKTDGTVTTLFQAGNTMYKWSGGNNGTFTSVGTVSSTAKLRGSWRSAVWNLTDVVIITDLSLTDTVYQWDGTTFKSVTFTDQAGNPFGSFWAKYCRVLNETAIYANVKDGSGPLPHMMIGSATSAYTKISTVNVPSNSIGTGDPYFLLSPDLKPINGALFSYLGAMISTQSGGIYNLNGTSAQNWAFQDFYANSGAVGFESVSQIGNDIIYGKPGRIESVRDTNTFGNSQMADLTAIVSDQIASDNAWTIVFNSRTRKAYAFPTGVSEVWVLDAAIRDAAQLSPWMRWRTTHALAFKPTFVASMLDPADGLEYIFMGDGSGNIYRMEGTGANGDGGANSIDLQFLTKLVSARLDSKAYDVEGYAKFTQQTTASTLTLTFQYQGENIFNEALTTTLPAAPANNYWGGGAYWGGAFYWGSLAGKLTRNRFSIPGHANEFQLLVEVNGTGAVSINEIGLRFRAASS